MPLLVFLPVSGEQAVALRSGGDIGVRTGCAATPSLKSAAGADASTEEVEYAALSYAGDLARTSDPDGRRLVLALDAEPGQVTDLGTELGEVAVVGLVWAQVRSLFADDPGDPADDADLLWYSTEELDDLCRRPPDARRDSRAD